MLLDMASCVELGGDDREGRRWPAVSPRKCIVLALRGRSMRGVCPGLPSGMEWPSERNSVALNHIQIRLNAALRGLPPRFDQVCAACPPHVGPSEVAIICVEWWDRRETKNEGKECLYTRVGN